MLGVGRIHVAVNVPAFTSFTSVDNGDGTVNISWTTIRATAVVVKNAAGTTVGSGGASGTISNLNIGYGITATFFGSASATTGGVASAQTTIFTAIGPIPVFTSATGTATGKVITLTWVATNCTVVTVYRYIDGVPTFASTKTASDSFAYTADAYSSTYRFILVATGTHGAASSFAGLDVSTEASPSGTSNFHYTGSTQSFVVPTGIFSVQAQIWGATGGGNNGGLGGYVSSVIAVIPGETLTVLVGGSGASHSGYNGGGTGGSGTGGGSSSIKRSSTALAVGGGGGASAGPGVNGYLDVSGGPPGVFVTGLTVYAKGGYGGGTSGDSFSFTNGGAAGTLSGPGGAGVGFGGASVVNGSPGSGATGGAGAAIAGPGGGGGGGGGGGYFGGGGGADASAVATGFISGGGSGGGGGSSFGPPGSAFQTGVSVPSSLPSATSNDGYVQIRYGF